MKHSLRTRTRKFKKLISFITLVALVMTTFIAGFVYATDESVTITLDQKIEYDNAWAVLDLVNVERAKLNKPALQMDKDLLSAAITRASEIALLFGHTRPNGQDWSTVPGLHKAALAENIAAGQISPTEVVNGKNGWANSTTHYEAIINDKYKSTGIACVEIGGTKWWVQVFSSQAASPVTAPANSTTEVKVSTLTKSLNVGLVMTPSVARIGTNDKIFYSVVNRNKEFDVPLKFAQFSFTLTPVAPTIATPGGATLINQTGEISTGTVAGKYSISAALSGTLYTVTKEFKINEASYTPAISNHKVSYKYVGEEDVPSDAPIGPELPVGSEYHGYYTDFRDDNCYDVYADANFDTGSKVYVMPPVSVDGSDFKGWKSDDVVVNADGSFKMPDTDVVFTGSFELTKYEVMFYDVDGKPLTPEPVVTFHGAADVDAPPILLTSPAVEGCVTYDYLYNYVSGTSHGDFSLSDGFPCKIIGGEKYVFAGWKIDAETANNAYVYNVKGFELGDTAKVGDVRGDVNLYTSWEKTREVGDDDIIIITPGLPTLDYDFKIFYYATVADYFASQSEISPPGRNYLDVTSVSGSADEVMKTQILPSPDSNQTISQYFNLNSADNSSLDRNVEWHALSFGYSNYLGDGKNIAPVTELPPYKKLQYEIGNKDGPGIQESDLNKLTTIGEFLELQSTYEDWYIHGDGSDEREYRENEYHELFRDSSFETYEKQAGVNYTAINIFLDTWAPSATFDANIPDAISGEFPDPKDYQYQYQYEYDYLYATRNMGLPSPVTLMVDSAAVSSTQKVNLKLPDNKPSIGGQYAQDYIFKGWSAVPSGGDILKPGEMIQLYVTPDNIQSGKVPIYAQWEKRTYSAYYYFQQSDDMEFASLKNLEWTSSVFPVGDTSASSIFAFLGVNPSDYLLTGTPSGWSKVILGSDDEGDDIIINSGEYYVGTPLTIGDFLKTRMYDYVTFILDWEAVKPAGMDLTVESASVDQTPAPEEDVVDDKKDADKKDSGAKEKTKSGDKSKNTDEDNKVGKNSDTGVDVTIGNQTAPLTGAALVDTEPTQEDLDIPVDSYEEPKGYEPVPDASPSEQSSNGGLTGIQIIIICSVIILALGVGLILAAKFGALSAIKAKFIKP